MSFPSPRLTAVSLVTGAVLITAGMAATPWESEATTSAYLKTIGANPEQGQIAAVLLHFGFLAMLPAVFGLVAALGRTGGKLRAIGGTLSLIGWGTMPGLLVVDFYAIALSERLPLAQAVAVEEAAQSMAGAAVFGAAAVLPAFLGLILLLVAAARARVVATWVPALYLVGILVSFGGLGLLTIVGTVISGAALVLTARALVAPRATAATPAPVARPAVATS